MKYLFRTTILALTLTASPIPIVGGAFAESTNSKNVIENKDNADTLPKHQLQKSEVVKQYPKGLKDAISAFEGRFDSLREDVARLTGEAKGVNNASLTAKIEELGGIKSAINRLRKELDPDSSLMNELQAAKSKMQVHKERVDTSQKNDMAPTKVEEILGRYNAVIKSITEDQGSLRSLDPSLEGLIRKIRQSENYLAELAILEDFEAMAREITILKDKIVEAIDDLESKIPAEPIS